MEAPTFNAEMVYQFHPVHLIVYLLVGIPLWFFNVIGNALVLICVYREKNLHKPSFYLVAALSLSDMCFPLLGFVPLTYTAFVKNPSVCTPVVQFYAMVPGHMVAMTSFLTMVTLSAERYCSIAFPIFHRKSVTTRRIGGAIVFNYIMSGATAITLYPFANYTNPSCPPFPFEFAIMVSISGVIGLVPLTLLNIHLLILIKRRVRSETLRRTHPSSTELESTVDRNARNASTKASKAVSIVVGVFILSWLPQMLCLFIEAVNYKRVVNLALLEFGRKSFILVFVLNGAVNPIVYARQIPLFRSAFRKLLRPPNNQINNSDSIPH